MSSDRLRSRLALMVTAALAGVIGWLTLTPLPFAGPPGGDKAHHLLAFAALVLPAAVLRPGWAPALLVFAAGFGAMIEMVQPHVGRAGEIGDLLADLLGAVLGALGGGAIGRRLDRAGRGAARGGQPGS